MDCPMELLSLKVFKDRLDAALEEVLSAMCYHTP